MRKLIMMNNTLALISTIPERFQELIKTYPQGVQKENYLILEENELQNK